MSETSSAEIFLISASSNINTVMETPSILKVTHPSTLVSMVITSPSNTESTVVTTPSYKEPQMTPVSTFVPKSVTDGEKKGRNEKSKTGGNNFYRNVSYVKQLPTSS